MSRVSRKKQKELDVCWENCLKMWKDIARVIERFENIPVHELKAEWLDKHGFTHIHNDCFFCDWSLNYNVDSCAACPGKRVDKTFICTADKTHFYNHPTEFCNLLIKLNRKRNRQPTLQNSEGNNSE